MKTLLSITTIIATAAVLGACTPKATQEECQASCTKLAGLDAAERQSKEAGKVDPAKAAAEQAAAKVAAAKQEHEAALAALAQEEAKAKGPKAKVAKEFTAKREALVAQYAEQQKTLEQESAKAAQAAQEAAAKAAAAEATLRNQQVSECNSQCVEKWPKTAIECQAKATTSADFKACAK